MKQRRKSTPGRRFMKVVCILLGLVLAVMVGATVYFQYLLGMINFIDPESTTPLSQEELDAYLSSGGEGYDPDAGGAEVEFDTSDTLIGGKGSGLVNILLIGQDRREGESRARSDAMILCTFNTKTNQIVMTSFLRDLYVQIPGYSSNRINAAYAAGGMTLLDETLESNFGVYIDGNVEVDFDQFAQIVDLLGGVEIELREDEAAVINEETGSALTQGTQLLNGAQALAYSRIRKLDADGDFARTSRQRKVMSAILDAYKDANLLTLLALMNDILPMITTDMSRLELVSYALQLFPLLGSGTLVSQRVPADGAYSSQMIDGMAVLVADMDAARQMLAETLTGD